MYQYKIIQWLFFFYFYCFCGWCIESAYVSIRTKRLTNRGFMRGPFLPLYGSGAIMMLVVSAPFRDNVFMVYLAGCLGATVLEYVTGVTMEALFKVRYWDYSKNKFNFQGHICLGTSLSWGFLTLVMTGIIQVQVEKIVLSIPLHILTAVTMVLTAGIFADFALSFKTAIDLKNILIKMEQTKQELLHIQKRLDVLIAVTNEEMGNRKEEFTESMADLKNSIESKLESLKKAFMAKPAEYHEGQKEEGIELMKRYAVNLELRQRMSSIRDFFQRDMIRSNPTMTSKKFKDALEELKQKASGKKDK